MFSGMRLSLLVMMFLLLVAAAPMLVNGAIGDKGKEAKHPEKGGSAQVPATLSEVSEEYLEVGRRVVLAAHAEADAARQNGTPVAVLEPFIGMIC